MYYVIVGSVQQEFSLVDGTTISQLFTAAKEQFGLAPNIKGFVFRGKTTGNEFQPSDAAPKGEVLVISKRR